jgi:hypothetical protein
MAGTHPKEDERQVCLPRTSGRSPSSEEDKKKLGSIIQTLLFPFPDYCGLGQEPVPLLALWLLHTTRGMESRGASSEEDNTTTLLVTRGSLKEVPVYVNPPDKQRQPPSLLPPGQPPPPAYEGYMDGVHADERLGRHFEGYDLKEEIMREIKGLVYNRAEPPHHQICSTDPSSSAPSHLSGSTRTLGW